MKERKSQTANNFVVEPPDAQSARSQVPGSRFQLSPLVRGSWREPQPQPQPSAHRRKLFRQFPGKGKVAVPLEPRATSATVACICTMK